MDETTSRSRHRSARSRTREADPGPSGLFVLGTDCGFAAIIFLLPYVMGGRQAWGHLLLGLLACWTALCWSLHQILSDRPKWRWSGAEPLFVMGLALLILQVVSLPSSTVRSISPAIEKRLPLWQADTEFGHWSTLSLTPHDTLASLLTVASCMLLFLTAVQRFQRAADVEKAVTWIGISAAGMAAFGTVQLLFGNGKFFWFYDHPFTDATLVAKGGFTNANHFAHFIALGVPIWLWKLATGEVETSTGRSQSGEWRSSRVNNDLRRIKTVVAASCLAIIGAGLLLSQSRGGVAVGSIGAAITLAFLWRQGLISAGLTLTICTLAVVSATSLAFFGDDVEALVQRSLSELATTDVEKLDQGEARRRIWNSALAAAKEYPIAGTGLSSHVEIYPTYYDGPSDGVEYTHAENGYIQVLMETGVTGLAIAVLFVLVVAYWCLRGIARSASPGTAAPLGAITAMLVMNLVHSLTDFIWYVPALMAVALILAAAAVRMYQLTGPVLTAPAEGAGLFSRTGWGVFACCVAAFAALTVRLEWPIVAAEPHWFNYIHLTRAMNADEKERANSTPDLGLVRRKLASIAAAVRANPNSHRAQMALARSYVQYVELKLAESDNAMPLAQIRDAARSNFESVDEMLEWLEKPSLLGERRKMLSAALNCTRRALRLCPFAGRGYLVLSDLAWLEGANESEEQLLVNQAYEVRPYDPRVHFVLGRRHFVAQEFDSAMEHWREAFDRDPAYRRQLIAGLAELVPPTFFLKNFEMDLESMRYLWSAYEKSPDEKGKHLILTRLADAEVKAAETTTGGVSVRHWMLAGNCYQALNDREGLLETAEAAVQANRNSVPARLRLGNILYENGDYDRAAVHLTWCVHRQPGDADLQARAQRAIMQQGKARTRLAKEPPESTTR